MIQSSKTMFHYDVFLQVPDSCVEDIGTAMEVPKEILRDFRRPAHFQRLDGGRQSLQNGNLLKDLAKISQMNISRLSNYCSYSMFSNESTESLNTTSSAAASPCSVRLAKSHSSQQVLKDASLKDTSPKTSISPLCKDPLSVPNFKKLQKSSSLEEDCPPDTDLQKASEILSKVEGSKKSSSLPPSEKSSPDCETPRNGLTKADSAMIKEEVAKLAKSDSSYTFQSYDCSSRSSTISSSNKSSAVRKSSSINRGFNINNINNIKLIDLEEEERAAAFYSSDEFSSLSGYESIETVNDEDDAESTMSFANPHYLGPDVQAILDRKKTARNNVLLRDESHQSFANALNSPTDSLFSDYQDFHARLNQDFVEMNSFAGQNMKAPTQRPKSMAFPSPDTEKSFVNGVPMREVKPEGQGQKKVRPVSAEICRDNRVSPMMMGEVQNGGDANQLMLLMYIIGGREIGQVTVFKRPISVWRLDLTKTF